MNPALAGAIIAADATGVEIMTTPGGLPSARVVPAPGKTILLHSSYDPVKEARSTLARFSVEGADYIVLLGLGLGYLLDALLEANPASACARYFVVEADVRILRAALTARDFTQVLSDPFIRFAWPVTGTAIADQWRTFFDPVMARGSSFVTWAPSASLHPDIYKSAAELIQSQTFQIFTDINTLVAKSRVFLDNFIANLPVLQPAPGVRDLEGRFAGIPAVIVSAGPSLDKNIHELRGVEDRALLLAADTALKPLLSAGVEPHYVCTADPTYDNYRHLEGAATRYSILVAESTAFPAALGDFAGRAVGCVFEDTALPGLGELLGTKGSLRAWGSVATMALDFALKLGCDPVIFVGQDLAHSDSRIYCSGVYFEREWFAALPDPAAMSARIAEIRSRRRLVAATDLFGREIETTDKLLSYWNWFVRELTNHRGTRFVNATEGGILRDGVEIVSLREALHRYCANPRSLREKVLEFMGTRPKGSPAAAARVLVEFARELTHALTILERGLRGASEAADSAPDVRQLERLTISLQEMRRTTPLVDRFNQLGNAEFLRRRAAAFDPARKASPAEVRAAYHSYFSSVRDAVTELRQAVGRIPGFPAEPRDGSGRRSATA